MVIAHNLMAANTNRIYGINDRNRAKSTEKLSSGYKINRAADDAAGLTISEKMRRQVRGLNQASRNVQDGISLIQVAEGGLTETHAILQRMNELCVQSANDTNTSLDRQAIQNEINDLKLELTRIAETTEFNQEIHPLNSGYELPDNIVLSKWTVTNDTPAILEYNGKQYGTGETFEIDNVSIDAPGSSVHYSQVAFGLKGGVGGWGHYGGLGIGDAKDITFNYNNASAGDVYVVRPLSLDDFNVDENGYVYYYTNTYNDYDIDKEYVGLGGSVVFRDAQGNSIENPTLAQLEAENLVKAKGEDKPIKIQAGSEPWQAIVVPKVKATASALGVNNLDVMSFETAGESMEKVQKAINTVSGYRSTFGAIQNRMEHAIKNLDNAAENTQSAESRIRDTDMAKEMVEFSKTSILLQVTQSMQAQANQSQQSVLQLLS